MIISHHFPVFITARLCCTTAKPLSIAPSPRPFFGISARLRGACHMTLHFVFPSFISPVVKDGYPLQRPTFRNHQRLPDVRAHTAPMSSTPPRCLPPRRPRFRQFGLSSCVGCSHSWVPSSHRFPSTMVTRSWFTAAGSSHYYPPCISLFSPTCSMLGGKLANEDVGIFLEERGNCYGLWASRDYVDSSALRAS